MIIVNADDDDDDVDKGDDVREKFPVDELGMMILASFFLRNSNNHDGRGRSRIPSSSPTPQSLLLNSGDADVLSSRSTSLFDVEGRWELPLFTFQGGVGC